MKQRKGVPSLSFASPFNFVEGMTMNTSNSFFGPAPTTQITSKIQFESTLMLLVPSFFGITSKFSQYYTFFLRGRFLVFTEKKTSSRQNSGDFENSGKNRMSKSDFSIPARYSNSAQLDDDPLIHAEIEKKRAYSSVKRASDQRLVKTNSFCIATSSEKHKTPETKRQKSVRFQFPQFDEIADNYEVCHVIELLPGANIETILVHSAYGKMIFKISMQKPVSKVFFLKAVNADTFFNWRKTFSLLNHCVFIDKSENPITHKKEEKEEEKQDKKKKRPKFLKNFFHVFKSKPEVPLSDMIPMKNKELISARAEKESRIHPTSTTTEKNKTSPKKINLDDKFDANKQAKINVTRKLVNKAIESHDPDVEFIGTGTGKYNSLQEYIFKVVQKKIRFYTTQARIRNQILHILFQLDDDFQENKDGSDSDSDESNSSSSNEAFRKEQREFEINIINNLNFIYKQIKKNKKEINEEVENQQIIHRKNSILPTRIPLPPHKQSYDALLAANVAPAKTSKQFSGQFKNSEPEIGSVQFLKQRFENVLKKPKVVQLETAPVRQDESNSPRNPFHPKTKVKIRKYKDDESYSIPFDENDPLQEQKNYVIEDVEIDLEEFKSFIEARRVLTVKLILTETSKTDFEKLIRQFTSPILDFLNLDSTKFGLFHSGLSISNCLLQWTNLELVDIRAVSSKHVLLATTIHKVEISPMELFDLVDRIAKEVVNWNKNFLYSQIQLFSDSQKKKGNCHNFVLSLLKVLEIPVELVNFEEMVFVYFLILFLEINFSNF